MRKKGYKFLAVLTAASMLMSSAPVMAAEEFSDDTFVTIEEIPAEEDFSAAESPEQEAFADGEEEILFEDEAEDETFLDEEAVLEEEEGVLAGQLPEDIPAARLTLNSKGMTNNINRQCYFIYGSPVYSYLESTDSGFLRVEDQNSRVLAEYYDSSFLLKAQKHIARELPLFGGFYAGKTAYYLAFGQNNEKENNNTEVLRIVKYDKNWKRLGSASLYGANTIAPFAAGSLRMAEYGNSLYVRTCHEMYKSEDGLNHQANLMMQVRTTDMSIVDSFHEVSNYGEGYVSHSFNQFVLVDDTAEIVCLDHGDAHPRAAILGRYGNKAGDMSFDYGYESMQVFPFAGPMGDNFTGCSLGGLEYSDSSYLVAGNSVTQDENYGEHDDWNVFVTASNRNAMWETSVNKITNYSEKSGIFASTPHLVKLGANSFLLLWMQMKQSGAQSSTLSYVFLDGKGNKVSSIYTKTGYLSDCKPTVSGGAAVWYVTDGEKLTFYKVNANGSFSKEVAHTGTKVPNMEFQYAEFNCALTEGHVKNPLKAETDGKITYSSDNEEIASVASDGTVTLKNIGTCMITATAEAGKTFIEKSISYKLNVLTKKNQEIKVAKSFTKIYGDKAFSLKATCLGGVKLSYTSSDSTVAKVSDTGTVTPLKIGTAQITITAPESEEHIAASTTVKITVEGMPIKKCKIAFSKIGFFSNSDFPGDILQVSYGDKILKPNQDYRVFITSWGAMPINGIWDAVHSVYGTIYGEGNFAGEVDFKNVQPIRKTSVIKKIENTSKGVKLTWEEETAAVGYVISRKMGNGSYKNVKKITDGRTTSWTDTENVGPKSTATYYIRAYTKDKNGKSIYASKSSTLTVTAKPAISSVKKYGSGMRITWKKVSGATGYLLQKYSGGKWTTLTTTAGTSYTDTKATKKGTTYKYRVRSYCKTGGKNVYSLFSSTKSGKR